MKNWPKDLKIVSAGGKVRLVRVGRNGREVTALTLTPKQATAIGIHLIKRGE